MLVSLKNSGWFKIIMCNIQVAELTFPGMHDNLVLSVQYFFYVTDHAMSHLGQHKSFEFDRFLQIHCWSPRSMIIQEH